MTEKDTTRIEDYIVDKLNPETLSGLCVPFAIVDSRYKAVPEKLRSTLAENIINAWGNNEEIEDWWLKMARLFYPDIDYEKIQFRGSQDKEFKEILVFAHEHKLVVLFTIPSGEDRTHAVAVKLNKKVANGEHKLYARLLYGPRRKNPILNVTDGLIVRDYKNALKDLLGNDCDMVFLPPESEMSF